LYSFELKEFPHGNSDRSGKELDSAKNMTVSKHLPLSSEK